jgi:hypothetical protein
LYFDQFSRSPGPVLERACAALRLPWQPNVLQKTRPGHAIGGNSGAMAQLRSAKYGVQITGLPEPELPKAHIDAINDYRPIQECFADLMNCYRQSGALT